MKPVFFTLLLFINILLLFFFYPMFSSNLTLKELLQIKRNVPSFMKKGDVNWNNLYMIQTISGNFGFINSNGSVFIPPVSPTLTRTQDQKEFEIVNSIYHVNYRNIHWTCISSEQYADRKYCVESSSQKRLSDFIYDKVIFINGEMGFAKKGNQYGFFSQFGEFHPKEELTDCDIDIYNQVISKNGKKGLIDQNLKIIVPISYDNIYPISELQLAIVKKEQKYGIISFKNKVIQPCQYEFIGKVVCKEPNSLTEDDISYYTENGSDRKIETKEEKINVMYNPFIEKTCYFYVLDNGKSFLFSSNGVQIVDDNIKISDYDKRDEEIMDRSNDFMKFEYDSTSHQLLILNEEANCLY